MRSSQMVVDHFNVEVLLYQFQSYFQKAKLPELHCI